MCLCYARLDAQQKSPVAGFAGMQGGTEGQKDGYNQIDVISLVTAYGPSDLCHEPHDWTAGTPEIRRVARKAKG